MIFVSIRMSFVTRIEKYLCEILVACLGRSLGGDNKNCIKFCSFIPRFLEACVGVLKEGADRDPDLIEQVSAPISSDS